MALGVISMLWSLGISVPGDVSVVGYDNVIEAEFSVPPLTTVHFDKKDMVDTALTLLTQRIIDPDRPTSSVIIPHRIIRRSSTRRRELPATHPSNM
jgi:DNA-binding LacI/PurR family transcriptional regulator